MRNPCRSFTRSRGRRILTPDMVMVKLWDHQQDAGVEWRNWTFRTVSRAQAERLVRRGEAEEIVRSFGGEERVAGYRRTKPEVTHDATPATLTMSVMHAVGKHALGYSLTPAQERHVEKFVSWPLIGDTKAVAVRPRTSEKDRRLAESVMRHGLAAGERLAA